MGIARCRDELRQSRSPKVLCIASSSNLNRRKIGAETQSKRLGWQYSNTQIILFCYSVFVNEYLLPSRYALLWNAKGGKSPQHKLRTTEFI